MIKKGYLILLVVLSSLVSIPGLLFSGLFYTSNIVDRQFGSLLTEFFPTGLIFLISLIPIISLFVTLKIKIESKKYNVTSLILLVINIVLIIWNILFSLSLFTQSLH